MGRLACVKMEISMHQNDAYHVSKCCKVCIKMMHDMYQIAARYVAN